MTASAERAGEERHRQQALGRLPPVDAPMFIAVTIEPDGRGRDQPAAGRRLTRRSAARQYRQISEQAVVEEKAQEAGGECERQARLA